MNKNTIFTAILLAFASAAWAVDPLPVVRLEPEQITAAELASTVIPENTLVAVSDIPGDLRIGNGSIGGISIGKSAHNFLTANMLTVSNNASVSNVVFAKRFTAYPPTNNLRSLTVFHDDTNAVINSSSVGSQGGTSRPISFQIGFVEKAAVRSNGLYVTALILGTNPPATNWPAGGEGSYDDSWTNGITRAAYGDYAGITNPPTIPTAAGITSIAQVVSTSYGFAPTGSVQAIAGEAATNAVGHGLDDYYTVDYATSIAINPSNGYRQGLFLAGTTTVSVAGGATNQMGSVRLDVWTGTNQHLFTNPVPAGTWSTSRVNIVQYIKTAFDTAWTARVFQW